MDEIDEKEACRLARQSAFDALARREYAVRELHAKLRAKGFSETVVSTIITELCTENLLSDTRYAEAYVHAYVNKGQGPLRLRHSLQHQGVDDELTQTLLDEEDWLTRARAVRRKRFGDDLPKTPQEYARQARFLSYRGFSSAHIRAVLRADE
jgi:regulatory protein